MTDLPTMRAAVLDAHGTPFREATVARPSPAPGQVLVRIAASGVNPLDTKIHAGAADHARHPLPAILGIDLAGTVEALGFGVTRFRVGDEVFGMTGGVGGHQGSLAEYAAVDADLLARKPAHLSMREASVVPLVFITAWEGLVDRTAVRAGQSVLVLGGAGGVGRIAIQIARAVGAEVSATGSTADRAAIEQLGARFIDRSEPVAAFVARLTGGRGFDLAFDTVGGPLLDDAFATAIAALAVLAFLALLIGYGIKMAKARDAVWTEFRHPIAGNLFGTVPISLLLLPIDVAPYGRRLAQAPWIVGAAGTGTFAWFIVSRWMSDRQQVAHATPAWVIPVVGLLDVPLALPSLGPPPMHGLMVFALAVGLFFATPLFTLVFSRLVFEPPLPDALKPSLLILVAPFAVGYSAYTVTAGQTDLFAEALFTLMLFVLAVLLGQLRHLPSCRPFRMSWWAVSFPLAASSIASLSFAAARPGLVTDAVALVLLALATLVIAALLGRTALGLTRGELRTLST